MCLVPRLFGGGHDLAAQTQVEIVSFFNGAGAGERAASKPPTDPDTRPLHKFQLKFAKKSDIFFVFHFFFFIFAQSLFYSF